MNFNKDQGDNKYNIFSTIEGYDLNIAHEGQSDLYGFRLNDTQFFKKLLTITRTTME